MHMFWQYAIIVATQTYFLLHSSIQQSLEAGPPFYLLELTTASGLALPLDAAVGHLEKFRMAGLGWQAGLVGGRAGWVGSLAQLSGLAAGKAGWLAPCSKVPHPATSCHLRYMPPHHSHQPWSLSSGLFWILNAFLYVPFSSSVEI